MVVHWSNGEGGAGVDRCLIWVQLNILKHVFEGVTYDNINLIGEYQKVRIVGEFGWFGSRES